MLGWAFDGRIPAGRVEVRRAERAFARRGRAPGIHVRGRLPPAHDREGPQPRHRVVLDRGRGVAGRARAPRRRGSTRGDARGAGGAVSDAARHRVRAGRGVHPCLRRDPAELCGGWSSRRPTRCPSWDVKGLAGHLWNARRSARAVTSPSRRRRRATADAVTYWRSYDPVDGGAAASSQRSHRGGGAIRRGCRARTLLRRPLAGLRRGRPQRGARPACCRRGSPASASTTSARPGCSRSPVHGLDLADALAREPWITPAGTEVTVGILRALLGDGPAAGLGRRGVHRDRHRTASARRRRPIGSGRPSPRGSRCSHDGPRTSRLESEVVSCRACPRLVAWREEAAREKVARFAGETYWARPLPGFGDPRRAGADRRPGAGRARGNRTGRIFTGDRSGDFLFAVAAPDGVREPPGPVSRDDGLRLRDAWVTAVNRCAPPGNKPDAAGARHVPAVPRARARRTRAACGRSWRSARSRGTAPCARSRRPATGAAAAAAVRSRRRGDGRAVHADRLLPPEPAEHVHRQAHRADDRRGVRRAGARPR